MCPVVLPVYLDIDNNTSQSFIPIALLLRSCSLAPAGVDCDAACLWWKYTALLAVYKDEESYSSLRDRTLTTDSSRN